MGVQNLTPIVHNLQVCVILNVYKFFFCSAFCVKTPYLEIDMKHILCKKKNQKNTTSYIRIVGVIQLFRGGWGWGGGP